MEEAGLIGRDEAPPPVATTLYHLTPRGEELRPVIDALGRWARPLMAEGMKGDAFRAEWMALPTQLYLTDRDPDRAPVAVEVRSGQQPMVVEARDGAIRTRLGPAADPDVVLTGKADVALALLLGRVDVPTAKSRGLAVDGEPRVLRRFKPVP